MATPVHFRVEGLTDYNNNVPGEFAGLFQVYFAEPKYKNVHMGYTSAWYELGTDDIPNGKYLDLDALIADKLSVGTDFLFNQLDGYYFGSGLTFEVGDITPVDQPIREYSQPINDNLTDIAAIAGGISSDMLDLLAADNVAAVKSAMALGISEVVGLQSALDGKAAASHTHAASDVNSGTFADARIAQSNVTQHQGALSLSASQITSGTKTASFISDFTEAAQDAIGPIMSGSDGVGVTYNDGTNTIVVGYPRAWSAETPSLVTSTSAGGTQISSTKLSKVTFSCSTSTTSTIGGPATSVVALEICATNSSTAGDWIEVARTSSEQTITLAIVLQSIQTTTNLLTHDVPPGWYYRLRKSGTGTHSEALVTGRKTIYG